MLLDGGEQFIRAQRTGLAEEMIDEDDHQTAHRQQIQKPRIGGAGFGGQIDQHVEHAAHQAAGHAHHKRQDEPPIERFEVLG